MTNGVLIESSISNVSLICTILYFAKNKIQSEFHKSFRGVMLLEIQILLIYGTCLPAPIRGYPDRQM